MTASPSSDLFDPRTSVFLWGASRSLLNWVAYALVADRPGGFLWGHVGMEGEVFDDDDLLSTQVIPRDRFIPVSARDLVRDEFAGNVALGALQRSEAEDEVVRRFADFLRLPAQTRELTSRLPREGPSPVLVLSGGQRLAALYPREAVGPTVRSIVEFAGSMLLTWAEASTVGRLEFEHILHVKGYEPAKWRDAVLTVERGWPTGPLETGKALRLGDLALVASVLGRRW